MTKCIEPSDPRYFIVTSDEPYDRHNYKVIRNDGESVVVDSWELAREIWWNIIYMLHLYFSSFYRKDYYLFQI